MLSNWPEVAPPGSSSPKYDNAPESPEALLNETQTFLERFIAYPNPESSIAHTLWIVHAHLIDSFENTPRLAFLSPEPGSGKSRAMELTEALSPRPVLSVNATPAYIFRKISDPEGKPTLLIDEADAIFSAKKSDGNEDLRGLLNSGYRQGATAGRATTKGREIVTEEWPSFCAVALAGLNALPETIMTRSVIIPMKRRRADQEVEPYRRRVYREEVDALRERLALFADNIRDEIGGYFPQLPETVVDRDADLWEPLIAISDKAGGHWPQTVRAASEYLVALSKNRPLSLGVRLLADIREVFGDSDRLSTHDLLEALHALESAPWGNLRGEPIDARFLAKELGRYGIETNKTIRLEERTLKGYTRSEFFDAWARYLPKESEVVTSVTSVTELQGEAESLCLTCGKPLHPVVIADGFTTCPTCPSEAL